MNAIKPFTKSNIKHYAQQNPICLKLLKTIESVEYTIIEFNNEYPSQNLYRKAWNRLGICMCNLEIAIQNRKIREELSKTDPTITFDTTFTDAIINCIPKWDFFCKYTFKEKIECITFVFKKFNNFVDGIMPYLYRGACIGIVYIFLKPVMFQIF